MDFGESQFPAPDAGGNGLGDFAAVPAASSLPLTTENGGSAPALADDFFSSSAPAPAAEDNPFGEAPAAPAPAAFAADPVDEGLFAAPAGDAAAVPAAGDEDPFFQHYEPPVHSVPEPEPQAADPRIAWRQANAEVLKKKDAEEAALKAKLKEAAEKHLAKFYEVRSTTLGQRKSNNRKSEAHQKEVEVPASGTPWEKVAAMVNLNASGHSKDLSRYKAVLITCKAKNVAIKA